MNFDLNDFCYSDWDTNKKKKKVKDIINILNSLTEEQKKAVSEFGRSCWSDGYFDGYREGESD